MKEFEGIIGHENHVRYLQSLAQKEVMPHAFLFVGPQGVGKTTLVSAFINTLIDGKGTVDLHTKTSKNFFDIEYIDVLEDKKEISVAQVREFLEKLTLTSAQGGHKFGVVMNAQSLNISASNALLKFLEEPPAHTHLILLATEKEHLLPTIISRCVVLTLNPVPYSLLSQSLTQLYPKHDASKVAQCAALAQGRPGIALEYLRDGSKFDKLQVQAQELVRSLVGLPHEKSKYITSVIDDVAWQEVATFVAHDMVHYQAGLHDQLLFPTLVTLYEQLMIKKNPTALMNWCAGIIEYDKIHAYTGNKQLFLENLFFNV